MPTKSPRWPSICLHGWSLCLFGDPEEIRMLNAHKVSQVTLYVSGDPCGVPKATMPTRSPRCIPVFVWWSWEDPQAKCPQGLPGDQLFVRWSLWSPEGYNVHKVSQVHLSVCMCMCLFYICVLACGHSLFLTDIIISISVSVVVYTCCNVS